MFLAAVTSICTQHRTSIPGPYSVSHITYMHKLDENLYKQKVISGNVIHLFILVAVAYPGIFVGGGSPTNSVEVRGQRELGSRSGSPLVRGSTQFANE
jgi:hypothetical protein